MSIQLIISLCTAGVGPTAAAKTQSAMLVTETAIKMEIAQEFSFAATIIV
jgi:hypothetical protein